MEHTTAKFDSSRHSAMAGGPQVSHDVQILQFNDNGESKNQSAATRNFVIELDVDHAELSDDEDCVFLRSEKILMSGGNNKHSPICVDGYFRKERDLRRTPKSERKIPVDIDSVSVQYVDDNDDVRIITVKPSLSPKPSPLNKRRNPFSGPSVTEVGESSGSKSRKPFSGPSVTEVGESSGSKSLNNDHVEVFEIAPDPVVTMFTCEICADSKPLKESFKIQGCSHSYCFDCMRNYVDSKLQDGVSQITCPVPRCPGLLEPQYCREILPIEMFDRWGKQLCESVILASQKFYCPFKDCSALLIDDGGEVITQSECPNCFRMFCAQCKVGWHEGIECSEYQKLREDEREKEDIMLKNLAKQKQWQRCPNCKFYVEKVVGCLYMRCRCGTAFCYNCGSIYTNHMSHYCEKCGR